MKAIDDLWKFDFRCSVSDPDVSIVIPAYGQVEATSECLLALAKSLEVCRTTAEVILIDDCSPNQDLRESFVNARGVRVYRNLSNRGFLKSCNKGVRLSRGRDVVLLNNDTLPLGQWLDYLCELKASRNGVKVVGARLVYPDGSLQESGGIVFKDGSGWNFGRGWSWDDPRATYPREVDYCSGAALLIDGEFARMMGPFDERYTPAYYEDTDLCFEARRSGGSVWVEPRAVVVHLEGLSNGTDLSAGVKKFQARNAQIFVDKWRSVLSDQFPAEEQFVWKARSRGAKPRIVVVDEEVPASDKNSGALRLTSILRLLRLLEFEVTFCPRNGRRTSGYTEELEAEGIEVLGPLAQNLDYLATIRNTVKAIWVARVDVASSVLPMLEDSLPGVKTIFDTVDLHHLRVEREEKITKQDLGAKELKQLELDLCASASSVVVVSDFEKDYLRKHISGPIHVVSNLHLSEAMVPTSAPKSVDAVFVGSFRHSPNADAVVWFCQEVLPLIVSECPNFRLMVVGEEPPESVVSLQSTYVEILGWVPSLEPILGKVRVNVAPLRFGAGVKGKISQALSIGLPTVTTSIGAEGMGLVHNYDVLIGDDPKSFADGVCGLLVDDQFWMSISSTGCETARRRFGLNENLRRMKEIVG